MEQLIVNAQTGEFITAPMTPEDLQSIKAVEAEWLAAQVAPERISDRQFFQQMAVEGKITETEALAAVRTGEIPQAMQALIGQLPEQQQFPAEMLVAGATEFLRGHPVTQLIGQLYGYDAADIDRIWREASLL